MPTELLANILQDQAQEYGCAHVSFQELWGGHDNDFLNTDPRYILHPKDAGHAFFASAYKAILLEGDTPCQIDLVSPSPSLCC